MSLRVYNTLTRTKDLFDPVQPGKVGMYLCGPTVYKEPHIGHMVGPVIFDAVKRYLQYKGFEVTWIVNITDVDDKLIDAASRKNTTMKELAERHTADYFAVLASMGVESIDRFPKASEHIAEIIDICRNLIDAAKAYAADGNVWFDVTKDADYGKLSHRRVEEQESGSRQLEGGGKRHPADFALWKAAKPGEPSWESPWGAGRPGWHIECSAMSMKYLGPTFDIHGGGLDLMFPHHENELAQSESATNQPFVKYWLHNGLTKLRTKAAGGQWQATDIHESTGNAAMVRAKDLVATHGAEVIRYLLLSTHYRSPIEFSDEALSNSKKALSVFQRLFERVERITGTRVTEKSAEMDVVAGALIEGKQHAEFAKTVLDRRIQFLERMDDDFNTAGAIAVLHELAGDVNAFIERNDLDRSKSAEPAGAAVAAVQSLRNLGVILGLFNPKLAPPAAAAEKSALTEQLMQLLIRLRQEARASKNFGLADGIRKGLTEIGVTLEDRPEGTLWRQE
jgi:cysteinyl-tRNA synthetase